MSKTINVKNPNLIFDPLLGLNFLKDKQNISINITKPKFEKNIFKSEREYEGRLTGYFSFVKHNEEIFAYYRVNPHLSNPDKGYTALLKSKDGLNYFRPNLNIVNLNNNSDNNLLFSGHISHAFYVFCDLKESYGMLFKGFGRMFNSDKHDSIELWKSTNGINWEREDTIISKINNHLRCFRGLIGYDTLNNVSYNPYTKIYRCFLRQNTAQGVRHIQTSVSTDLKNWSKFQMINLNNYNIYLPTIELYPNSPFYLGFPTYQNLNDDYSKYISIIFSRNGVDWINLLENQKLFPEIKNPLMACSGLIQMEDKLFLYIHHVYKCRVDAYSFPNNRITFITNTNKNLISTFRTKYLKLKSFNCYLNYQTEDDGYISIKLFKNDCLILSSNKITGDQNLYPIIWSSDNTHEIIENKLNNYHFEFTMFKCKIYGIFYEW